MEKVKIIKINKIKFYFFRNILINVSKEINQNLICYYQQIADTTDIPINFQEFKEYYQNIISPEYNGHITYLVNLQLRQICEYCEMPMYGTKKQVRHLNKFLRSKLQPRRFQSEAKPHLCTECIKNKNCKVCNCTECKCKHGLDFKNNRKLKKYIQIQNTKKNFSIGFEFEYELNRYADRREDIKNKIELFRIPFLYGVYGDGSLDNGNEYLALPKTIKFFRTKKFKKLFQKLTENAYARKTCGLHFNIDRKYLSDEQIMNMVDLLIQLNYKNRYGLLRFFNRTNKSMEDYAKISTRTGKYNAINTSKGKVVEFRFFGATKVYRQFMKYIDFIEVFYKVSKNSCDINLFLNELKKKGIEFEQPKFGF